MGLDMYAVRRTIVKKWNFQQPEEQYSVNVLKGGLPAKNIFPPRITVIEEEVMSWRKAYHIHGWFVRKVQEGKDGYGHIYHVPESDLEELRYICDQIAECAKLVRREGPKATSDQDTPRSSHGTQRQVIYDPTLAKDLLPISTGRFAIVSDDEYDEHYLKDVIDTRDWIDRMFEQSLEDGELTNEIFYYTR